MYRYSSFTFCESDLCLVPEERIHSCREERRLGSETSDTVPRLRLVYEWRSRPVSASAFPLAQFVQFAHTSPDRDSRCVVASHNLRGERVPSRPRWDCPFTQAKCENIGESSLGPCVVPYVKGFEVLRSSRPRRQVGRFWPCPR